MIAYEIFKNKMTLKAALISANSLFKFLNTMKYNSNPFFFILLVSAGNFLSKYMCITPNTEICAERTTNSSSKYSYDITKALSSCIANLFHNVEEHQVNELLSHIINYDQKKFEYHIEHEKKPFHNKLYFSGINITGSRWVMSTDKPHIKCSFNDKKVILFSPQYTCLVATQVGPTNDSIYSDFYPNLYFWNISITVAKRPKNSIDTRDLSILYSYDKLSFSYTKYTSFNEEITSDRKLEVESLYKKAATSLFLYNLIDNEKFLQPLDENFLSQPGKSIIPTHPRFLGHEQRHFYFIPNVPFYWFNLSNVTIRGLWNFQSLAYTELINNATSTLVVKDVRGSLTLDYGCPIEKPLELNFIADSIGVSVDYVINEINVEAREYHVLRTVVDTPRLTHRQATVIMRQIEPALASTIFPTMKFWRNVNQSTSKYDTECPLEKFFIETTEKPTTNAVKQFFKNWIPFNDR